MSISLSFFIDEINEKMRSINIVLIKSFNVTFRKIHIEMRLIRKVSDERREYKND